LYRRALLGSGVAGPRPVVAATGPAPAAEVRRGSDVTCASF